MTDNRPTKKQRELLNFLDTFIKGNGYGPSYREVMRALDYKSVSTVATHIDGLIARGYLRKRDNSARSLEIVMGHGASVKNTHIAWLEAEVKKRAQLETREAQEEVKILGEALKILDQPTN